MLNLPLPCRYSDLTNLASRGEIPAISIFVDVSSDSVYEWLGHWRSLLQGTHLNLFVASFNRGQAESFVKADGNSSVAAVIPDNFVDVNQAKKSGARIWATCAPYDASGVYVKTEIEKSLVSVIHRSKGIFIVHDPANKIIRQYDYVGLRGRVVSRVWRKWVYHFAWRTAVIMAWILARLLPNS